MNKDIFNLVPQNFDAVILAAGDFPSHLIPIRILTHFKELFVCDGALQDLLEYDIIPTAIIGDGDSLPKSLKERFREIYHQVKEQDDNDLTKATFYALRYLDPAIKADHTPRFCYLGATGKREDHTLGNIALMMHYFSTLDIEPTMITDYGWFTPTDGDQSFHSFPRQQVSIFNFSATKLSSSGLRWDLFPFQQLWQGTLNEAKSDSFTVHSDGKYMVYQTFEGKK